MKSNFPDLSYEKPVDFAMAGNWLGASGGWIVPDVVTASGAEEFAAGLSEFSEEIRIKREIP